MRLAGLAKLSFAALLSLSLSFLVERREALAFRTPLAVTFIDQRNRMGVLPPRTERRNPALVAPRRGFAVGSNEPIAAARVRHLADGGNRPGHLLSWAGLVPRNDESAGKRRSTRLRKGAPWLKTTLVQCAWAASRKKESYFKASALAADQRRPSAPSLLPFSLPSTTC